MLSNNMGKLTGQIKHMSDVHGGKNGGRVYKYIGVSVKRDRPNQDGKFNFDYINLTIWQKGDDPETYFNHIDYLKKDDMVDVEYTVRTSSYESNGQQQFRMELVLTDIRPLPIVTLGPLKQSLVGIDNVDYSKLGEAKGMDFKAEPNQVVTQSTQQQQQVTVETESAPQPPQQQHNRAEQKNVSIDMNATLSTNQVQPTTPVREEAKPKANGGFRFIPDN